MKLFLDCEKAGHICDKAQYEDANLIEIVRFKLHLMHCKSCKKHSAKNTKLTEAIARADIKSMPLELKEELSLMIDEKINQEN
ncbi:MAG: hypothetical protein WBG71_04155 [Leeuwenhoekiella sp.]